MDNWYVLFVTTTKEYMICNYLNKEWENDSNVAFVPQVEWLYRKPEKKVGKELKPMFPGYIFIESSLEGQLFYHQNKVILKSIRNIVKLLGKENLEFMAINKIEKDCILQFCNDKHIVEESSGIKEGDKIFIVDGPLKGHESIIKKISKRNKYAIVKMNFFGGTRTVRLSLNIINKV